VRPSLHCHLSSSTCSGAFCIQLGLCAGWPGVWVLAESSVVFWSSKLRDPPSLLFSGYWVPSPLGIKRPECVADYLRPRAAQIENKWSCTSSAPLYSIPSRHAKGQLYLYLFCRISIICRWVTVYVYKGPEDGRKETSEDVKCDLLWVLVKEYWNFTAHLSWQFWPAICDDQIFQDTMELIELVGWVIRRSAGQHSPRRSFGALLLGSCLCLRLRRVRSEADQEKKCVAAVIVYCDTWVLLYICSGYAFQL
jgi:hypothetical protein